MLLPPDFLENTMPPISDAMLTDTATVKRWLDIGVDDTGADDLIPRLIEAASSTFMLLMQRDYFLSQSITEVVYGSGGYILPLKGTPVTNVTSVSTPTKNILFAANVFSSGYRFDSRGIRFYGDMFYQDEEYTIVYVGGYAPSSLQAKAAEQAVISIIALWYKRRKHSDQLAQSLGNQLTVKFVDDDIPPEARLVAQRLKKVA